LLSDIVIESGDSEGFADPKGKMDLIRNDPFLSGRVEAMSATLESFAMIQFDVRDRNGFSHTYTRPVHLIGVDPERAKVGGFSEFLVRQKNNANPSFNLPRRAPEQAVPKLVFRDLDPAPALAPGEKPPPDPPEVEPFD